MRWRAIRRHCNRWLLCANGRQRYTLGGKPGRGKPGCPCSCVRPRLLQVRRRAGSARSRVRTTGDVHDILRDCVSLFMAAERRKERACPCARTTCPCISAWTRPDQRVHYYHRRARTCACARADVSPSLVVRACCRVPMRLRMCLSQAYRCIARGARMQERRQWTCACVRNHCGQSERSTCREAPQRGSGAG